MDLIIFPYTGCMSIFFILCILGLPAQIIVATDTGLRIFDKPHVALDLMTSSGKLVTANKIESIDAFWNPPKHIIVFSDHHYRSIKQDNRTLVSC